MDELKIQIIDAATELFAERGLKFTMQEVATKLRISKKTVYAVFSSKEELLEGMLQYGFLRIKEAKDKVLRDESLTPQDRLAKLLIALPNEYERIDFRLLYELGEKYPTVQKELENYLTGGWEPTLALMEEGRAQGWIRTDVNIDVMRIMFTASIEHFLQGETAGIGYAEALDEMTKILMKGILS